MVSFRRSGGATAEADVQELVAPSLPSSAAAFPRVNLMPEVIAAEAKVRQAKSVLVGAAVCSLLAVGGLYVMASNDVNAAQERVDTATAQTLALQKELAKYADVPKVQAEVALAQQQAYIAMGGEVRFSFLLNNLALTIPRNASLTSFTATINGIAPDVAAVDAQGDVVSDSESDVLSVLGTPGIGTIEYTGEARRYADVAAFLDALAKQKTLLDPFPGTVQTAEAEGTAAGKGVTFDSKATITAKALSNRYDPKAGN
jgi:Tfp pilus assembly protein PilN